MRRLRIAVLRGGPSSESMVSLATGRTVIDILSPHHEVYDIVLDQYSVWHIDSKPIDPQKFVVKIDYVFNAMHG